MPTTIYESRYRDVSKLQTTRVEGLTANDPCPRCQGEYSLKNGWEGLSCMICGFDQHETPPMPEKKPLLASSTNYMAQYVGDSPAMKDIRCWVVIKGVYRNFFLSDTAKKLVTEPFCPWCNEPMTETPLSGRRRVKEEKRFECSQGHRISLVPEGWK